MFKTDIHLGGTIGTQSDGSLVCSLKTPEETIWLIAKVAPISDESLERMRKAALRGAHRIYWAQIPQHLEMAERPSSDQSEQQPETNSTETALSKQEISVLSYSKAISEFMELQERYPVSIDAPPPVGAALYWTYRGKILRFESTDPELFPETSRGFFQITENAILLMKQFVLRREKRYAKARREIEALENIEKLEGVSREPIPESIRLFVWQRDKGACAKCGSRELLEFDHIIPIALGGSSTERNLQLFCEGCNRSKGSAI